jgi:hypothetical protein
MALVGGVQVREPMGVRTKVNKNLESVKNKFLKFLCNERQEKMRTRIL